MKKITIRDERGSIFEHCEAEVLIEHGREALVVVENERAILIVTRSYDIVGKRKKLVDNDFYKIEGWLSAPDSIDFDHWMTMLRVGLP